MRRWHQKSKWKVLVQCCVTDRLTHRYGYGATGPSRRRGNASGCSIRRKPFLFVCHGATHDTGIRAAVYGSCAHLRPYVFLWPFVAFGWVRCVCVFCLQGTWVLPALRQLLLISKNIAKNSFSKAEKVLWCRFSVSLKFWKETRDLSRKPFDVIHFEDLGKLCFAGNPSGVEQVVRYHQASDEQFDEVPPSGCFTSQTRLDAWDAGWWQIHSQWRMYAGWWQIHSQWRMYLPMS